MSLPVHLSPGRAIPSSLPSRHQNSQVRVVFQTKSSRGCSGRRVLRWAILLALCGLPPMLYLTINCWPAIFGLFEQRHYLLDELNQAHHGRTCFGHRPRSTLPSLLVRPLKHVSESSSVQSLQPERLQHLLQLANGELKSANCTDQSYWQSHRRESLENRRSRLKRICSRYGFEGHIFTTWHKASNRRHVPESSISPDDSVKYCSTRYCPLLVNTNHRILTCFVQKVASTSIKRIFLGMTSNGTSDQPVSNLTKFHLEANRDLYRVSPMYLKHSPEEQFYKTLFVRHPFVRLVSAFKDKAERGPEEEPYFYARYWNPLLVQLRGNQSNLSRVTFREFVEDLLLPTDPYQYDEHWAPIWTRCEPCYVHYDFVGKLETADNDFAQFKSHLEKNLLNVTVWENANRQFGTEPMQSKCQLQESKYRETVRYLAQLPPKTIIELYKRYYLDFELFGYTLEELFEVVN